MQQHRGVLILVLGILGLTACAFCAPFAWYMGNNDLKEIRAGRMDPEGEQMTNIGRILGMIGSALMLVVFCIVIPLQMLMVFTTLQQG
jgi:hypothetical protein